MPVPFGISIGDFIALINVTVTIVNALKDSTGSTKEYQDVVRELESLSLALINVRDIKTDRTELKAALTSVVSNCGRTVQDFLNKIRRFEVSLGTPGCSRRKFRDGLRKIQWALYSKDDIRSFQMELYSHTASLNILLTQVNHIMSSAAQQEHQRALNDHSQALIRIESKLGQERIGASTMQVMILSAITQCLSEFRSLVAFILFSNLKLISCVVEASRIPPQVTFEKPVVFEDAHGRILPVQMVWIKSWENFETMLKMGFSDVPGLSLIKRGEYVLTDVHSKTDLQKTRPIQTAFRPGRKINMINEELPNEDLSSVTEEFERLREGKALAEESSPNPELPSTSSESDGHATRPKRTSNASREATHPRKSKYALVDEDNQISRQGLSTKLGLEHTVTGLLEEAEEPAKTRSGNATLRSLHTTDADRLPSQVEKALLAKLEEFQRSRADTASLPRPERSQKYSSARAGTPSDGLNS
ncbi:MAG: hypothetical protein M1822_004910 [Bathelium mastoideum]|nr:MAG: hypothetical protein M1822_004910 [Bathelium mastoideum]